MSAQIIVLPSIGGSFTFSGTSEAVSGPYSDGLTIDKFIGIRIVLVGSTTGRTKTTTIYSGGEGSLAAVQAAYSPSISEPRTIVVAVSIFNNNATRNCTTTFDVSQESEASYSLSYSLIGSATG